MGKSQSPTFEAALKRLETIIAQLESPDITLDETLALFREGKKLSETCQKRLTEVERRVSALLEQQDGELALEDFEADEEDED